MERHHLNGEVHAAEPEFHRHSSATPAPNEVTMHARFALLRLLGLIGTLAAAVVIGKCVTGERNAGQTLDKQELKAPDIQKKHSDK